MDKTSKGKRLCITLTVLLATGAVSFAQFEKPIPKAVSLLPVKDTVTVTFLGDMMMHSKQLEYDCSSFIKELGSITADADISIANLEFTLAGKPYSGYPAFSAPDSYAEDLASKGVDIFLTANNHILDKGSSISTAPRGKQCLQSASRQKKEKPSRRPRSITAVPIMRTVPQLSNRANSGAKISWL